MLTNLLVILSMCVQHKQAANVGGGGMSDIINKVVYEVTTQHTAFFHKDSLTNITIQSGATATLHCMVTELADNTTVSWLKKTGDKLNLVSVGSEVYSSDGRYSVITIKPNDWTLQIKWANLSDQGQYECQVSSHPPIHRSLFLNVIVPQTEIADERSLPIKNKFYNSGSTIELRCVISKVPQPTQFIIWRHNSTILNYDTTRGGISVKTDILPDGARSQLYIANVGPADSGIYTCSLGDMAVTSVAVVVITGETPAAMQHGGAIRPAFWSWACALATALPLLSAASS